MIQRIAKGILLVRPIGVTCAAVLGLLAVCIPGLRAAEEECLRIDTRSGEGFFRVEVADTPDAMSQGLMWRTRLPENHGMLFVYDSPRHASFWMKNTLISLDILFIAADGRIHRIAYDTEPLSLESIPSGVPVRAVLEIAAGVADKVGVRPGDRVHHPALGDSRSADLLQVPDWCR